MGFWSKLGKGAMIAGAGAATYFSGGLASPALGAAIKYATNKKAPAAGGEAPGVMGTAQPGGNGPMLPGMVANPKNFEDAYKNYVLKGMDKSTNLSDEISTFSRNQHSMAEPATQKAMQYYTNLASGDRNAVQGAIAPSVMQANQTYNGAQKGLSARLAPGPQKDRAMADLYKLRAGQIGMMPFMASNDAYGKLGAMGQQGYANALQGYQTAGSMLAPAQYGASNIFQAQSAKDQANASKWGAIGSAGVNILGSWLLNKYGGGGGGGGNI